MKRNPYLTKGMADLIKKINASEDKELIHATPGGWWVDDGKVSGRVCQDLLKLCLLHSDGYNDPEYEYFTIHKEAVKMLTNVNHVPALITALKEQKEALDKQKN